MRNDVRKKGERLIGWEVKKRKKKTNGEIRDNEELREPPALLCIRGVQQVPSVTAAGTEVRLVHAVCFGAN